MPVTSFLRTWIKKLCPVIFSFVCYTSTIAQNVITGQVKDSKGWNLVGVSIYIKGTSVGTVTDTDGFFSIKLTDSLRKAKDNVTLLIRAVGYIAREITLALKDSSFISLVLEFNESGLNEVVVVGYDIKKKNPKSFVSFPWPPPVPSAQKTIQSEIFSFSENLGDVNKILTQALESLGYVDRAYYYVPGGFVLVTKIEQINEKGEPLSDPGRWSIKVRPIGKLSWQGYLKSLFFTTPGYFRILAFVVTNKSFSSSRTKVSRQTALEWLYYGMNILPYEIGQNKYSKDHYCTILIYEYKKPESDEAILDVPSLISTENHLKNSKIINALNR
jgi:hypothetical protein